MAYNLVKQIPESKHIHAAYSDGITKAQFIKLIHGIIETEIIHLVDHKQNGLSGPAEQIRNIPVIICQTLAGIRKKAYYICQIHGCLCLGTHLGEKCDLAVRINTSRVHQRKGMTKPFGISMDPVAGYPGNILHNTDPSSGDFIEKS